MKKLSNKQKLISGIAIILIVVIFAIIITTKVINNGIGSEKYSSNNSNMYSNLIANYIKKGITIGGITGTLETLDTSDATAVPEDILWGKTGYVNGVKIVGTKFMVNSPKIMPGMTPIKFIEATENSKGYAVDTTIADKDWYDYEQKKWANARTQDGSMWVWIPRFAYKLNKDTQTTEVVFLVLFHYPANGTPYTDRGGYYLSETQAGLFYLGCNDGISGYGKGFRVALI